MKILGESTRKTFETLCLSEKLDREQLKKLLDIKDFVKRSFEDGSTPLHFALKSQKINKLLIEVIALDSDLNQKNSEGKTPLEVALEKKEYLVAYLLIKKGARLVFSKTQHVRFLKEITLALKNEDHHELILKALILHLNKQSFINLCQAEAYDPVEFKRLVSIKGFIESDVGKGYTPLQYAIACHYQRDKRYLVDSTISTIVAKTLIQAGARFDQNRTKKSEYSPIALAIKANQLDLLSMMLERGADPNHINQDGNTLLTTAVYHAEDLAVLERLLLEGADPLAKNRNGSSALAIALENKHYSHKVNLMRSFILSTHSINKESPRKNVKENLSKN